MFCAQLKIYLVYLFVQLFLSLFLFGNQKIRFGLKDILGPGLFIGTIYYLCEKRHDVVANVLIGVVIVTGLGLDLKPTLIKSTQTHF